MADVTISSLPFGTPFSSAVIPFSQSGQTYSTTLLQLSSLPFIPKAWVNFDGTGLVGTNQTIRASYNVNRVLKNNTGDYTVYFQTFLSNSSYVITGTSQPTADVPSGLGISTITSPTTTLFRVLTWAGFGPSKLDSPIVTISVFGN